MVALIPLAERIGVEARGIDVNTLSDKDFETVYQAWLDATILLVRGQSMTMDEQADFTDRFGSRASYTRAQFSPSDAPDILILSNIREDGRLIGSPVSGRVWHTDGHYLTDPPAGSIMHAIEVPTEGGDTMFANMAAAWDDLPEALRDRIEGLEVMISRLQSRPYNYPERPPPTETERAEWIDVPQPMVRIHPATGRKALYAGGNVPWKIVGMDEAESAPLVTFVQEFAIRPRYIYRHRWQAGDIIVWDNRSAMHRATPYDGERHRRRMHRTTFGERVAA